MRVTITNAVGAHKLGDTPDLDPADARRLVHEGYAIAPDPKAKNKTVDEVLAEVGDDPAAAAVALATEQAAKRPRSSLVEKLTTIANPQED